jgi:hypothetical protein
MFPYGSQYLLSHGLHAHFGCAVNESGRLVYFLERVPFCVMYPKWNLFRHVVKLLRGHRQDLGRVL